MADDILFETGDDLTVENLGEAFGREGISDYVESGLGITADYQAAVADIDSGKAFVLHNGRDVTVRPDARAGKPIATDGVNYVYLTITESQNADGSTTLGVEYVVQQSETAPAGTALLVGEIDMGAQTVTERNRTAPIYRRDAETYKGNDIDPDGDGTVADADHAAVADSANSVAGADVSGQVNAAAVADAIVSADYGDLVAGDLIHTAGDIGDTEITLGVDGKWLIGDDGTADGAFIWRDPTQGILRLGGDNAETTLATPLNAGGNRLYNIATTETKSATVSQSAAFGNNGLRVYHDPNATTTGIAPIQGGDVLFGEALTYQFGDKWSTAADVRIGGDAIVGGALDLTESSIAGDEWAVGVNGGADFASVTAKPPTEPHGLVLDKGVRENTNSLIPLVDNTLQYGQGFEYYRPGNYWTVKTDLRVNGTHFGLPTVSTDPSGAPTGAMWYRSDLD